MARHLDPSAPPEPTGAALRSAVRFVLVVLPVAHLLHLSVGGAVATGADVAVAALVLMGVAAWVLEPGSLGRILDALGGRGPAGPSPETPFLRGSALLLLLAIWTGLSGQWGFHAEYAAAKGVGMAALVLVAVVVGGSGISWERAVDAWLLGAGVALAVTFLGPWAPEALQRRILYGGGGVAGLPFGRISGPWIHPNMMGDYLVVTGALLWGRWPGLTPAGRRVGAVLAGGLLLALALSVSTAWIGAGVAAVYLARRSPGSGSPTSWGVRLGGVLVAGVALVGVLGRFELSVEGMAFSTSGLRPAIWASSAAAILEAPLFGVGAAPYLASVPDPFKGDAPALWDAHNAFLSVGGQFGLVGLGLFLAGIRSAVFRTLGRGADPRIRAALTAAWIAVGVNALFLASEDLRHLWFLLGLTGAAAWSGAHRQVE